MSGANTTRVDYGLLHHGYIIESVYITPHGASTLSGPSRPLTILKQVIEEKLNATNIELATTETGKTFHIYSK